MYSATPSLSEREEIGMKKIVFVLSILAMCGFVLGACGGDGDGGGAPHCESTGACDPACDATADPPEVCCDGTCEEMQTCDPPCDTATEVCNPCTGACEALPEECDPPCEDGQYCDDGTCKDLPCDPPCSDPNEACVDGECVACDPACGDDEICVP